MKRDKFAPFASAFFLMPQIIEKLRVRGKNYLANPV
jgi:hypothetical protein